jgi:valyl-tRNA synthetase
VHLGHAFSYTHPDLLARFWRMRGKEVFYPVGWDDNGLPTERRVQNYYGVRCDPSLPYDPEFVPPGPAGPGRPGPGRAGREARAGAPRGQVPVSRRNFVELCLALTEQDERAYAAAWRRLGLSVDWSIGYRTIDQGAQAVSQRAFLRDLAAGEAYLAEGPSLWDVTFASAVAQAELEDREITGQYVRIAFDLDGSPGDPAGGPVPVATTRPELLPACVALVAHPDDERYAALFGRTVRTPLFGVSVPVLAHRLAEPAKGTGIAMVCTFGDITDLTWWRDLGLDTRPVIGKDGRLLDGPLPWLTSPAGQAAYRELAGLPVTAARARVTELLRAAGELRGEPEPVVHAVKFYEYGEAPLEIVATRQWYIRNGGRDPGLREALLARGRELDWHPPHMRARYEDWVAGLAGDWLVSRQRYFGVPIPVWYPLDDAGAPRYDAPIVPDEDRLPVDPAVDAPPGYAESQRAVPGGFTGDPDVMDTWATSSLSPRLACGGLSAEAEDLYSRVFPMDLRPQAHDIIRTWLFYTVLRSHVQHGVLPWRHVGLSGWILDPDRKKMSKSKGNATTPAELLREYGSDAVRYWAASARLGVDAVFDPGQLKIGRRLAVKILNASRFVLGLAGPGPGAGAPAGAAGAPVSAGAGAATDAAAVVTEPLDRAMLGRLAAVVDRCTEAFEAYDHALALELTERFFWFFCDDYLELAKPRAYGGGGEAPAASAVAALRLALSVLLRLFAPFLPFVTEEVWSWTGSSPMPGGSIHRASWPTAEPLRLLVAGAEGQSWAGPACDGVLDAASAAIGSIRKAKSQARLPMRASVRKLVVTAPAPQLTALAEVLGDVRAAGAVAEVELREGPASEPVHDVTI